jgi:hypothetical protein
LTWHKKNAEIKKNNKSIESEEETMEITPMIVVLLAILVIAMMVWFKPSLHRLRIFRVRRLQVKIMERLHLVLFAKWWGVDAEWGIDWSFDRFLREIKRARGLGCETDQILGKLAQSWEVFPELKEVHNQGGPEALERYIEYLKIP